VLLALVLGALAWRHGHRDGPRRAARPLPPAPVVAGPPVAQATVESAAPVELARAAAPDPPADPEAALTWSAPSPSGFSAVEAVDAPALSAAGGGDNDTIRHWRANVDHSSSNAFGWRQLADALAGAGRYPEAVEAYRREAALYRQRGDADAALIEEGKADGWDARVVLYRQVAAEPPAGGGLAKFEPASGCYLGANVEADPRVRGDYRHFAELTGRQHAIYFDYLHYGERFPTAWANRLKAAGAAMQIAFEPNRGLDAVRDDAYLQGFARDAAAAGLPIWLRFASEMNGDWTAWSGSPERFKAAWRTVATVMRRLASNVALVWAPNVVPERNITDYYPGDEWVDWVGVNFYCVHHHDNDPSRPSVREDPSDLPRFLYQTYAERKPIMVCETAVTHYCRACGQAVGDFAFDKIGQLYGAVPRRYPRLKAICWYDLNNLDNASARPERRSNNFSVTEDAAVLAAYRRQIASPYYLSRVAEHGAAQAQVRFAGLDNGAELSGQARLSAWVRTWVDRPTVVWRLDGVVQCAGRTRPYEARWDTTAVAAGAHSLEILAVVDGAVAARQTVQVRVTH
jgi:hypothetical protein